MTPTERIRQADADALLLAESFALGMGALGLAAVVAEGPIAPTAWDKYVERWTADVDRKCNERFRVPEFHGGAGGTGGGPVADLGSPANSGNPEPVGNPT